MKKRPENLRLDIIHDFSLLTLFNKKNHFINRTNPVV